MASDAISFGVVLHDDGGRRAAAVRTLVAAFADDPGWRATLGDRDRRAAVLGTAFRALVDDAARHAVLMTAEVDGEVLAVSVVWPPGYHPSPFSNPAFLLSGLALARAAGGATVPLLRRWQAIRAVDPRAGHWHVAAVGVRPDAQRRGVGSALLARLLERVDLGGDASYLETTRPELVRWYRRSGYRVCRRLTLGRGRRAWTMWRVPVTRAEPS